MAKVRLKIAKVRKGESGRVRFEVSKLEDLEVRGAFKLALHNRFEGLQQLMEEEELSVDDEWKLIEHGYVETCEQILGRAKANSRVDQEGDFGGNRAAKGGKKHHEHGQNAKPEERCKQKVSRVEQGGEEEVQERQEGICGIRS